MNQKLDKYLLSRRRVLQGASALSASCRMLGRPAFGAPADPLNFVGWQYQPQIVEENVGIFSKLYDENVNYELVTGDYHAIVETKLTGGQHMDMFYSEEDRIARWHTAGWIRDLEGLPGVDDIKAGMFPVSVASLSLPDGKFAGMPYYAGYNAFIYNEEHLTKAGIAVPDSWDALLEACRKLKADGISDAPYHSAWGQKWPELSWSIFSAWYSEGAKVFDDNGDFVDEPSLRKMLDVHKALYQEKLVAEDIMTLPGEGVPSYCSGRHTFMVLHDYDQKVTNDPAVSKIAGKVKNALMPGATHSTMAWTAAYLMGARAGRCGPHLEPAAVLRRQVQGRTVPRHQALGARVRPRLRLQGSDDRPGCRRDLLQVERPRCRLRAARCRHRPQDRQGDLVPGMGSVHDAAGAGIHPLRLGDGPGGDGARREGCRA